MRIRNTAALISTLVFISGSAWAQSPGVTSGKASDDPGSNRGHASRRNHHGSQLNSAYSRGPFLGQRYGLGSGFGYLPYVSQSYGWQAFNYGVPQSYFPNATYLYFYDLYYQEAQRSKQEADEFEATLERQGKLTGPAKVGAFPSDYLPLPSRAVTATRDGKEQSSSPSGSPLVIGSGRHTLRITTR